MAIEPVQLVQDTQAFLRMAVIELRRIAEYAPNIAIELQHLAQQLDAEAEGLARVIEAKSDPAIRAEA
jgi:hypothetical protein